MRTAGPLWKRFTVKTGETVAAARGILTPDTGDSARQFAPSVGERPKQRVRFFGTAAPVEDGVSVFCCDGKRFLVLESRRVPFGGQIITDAILQET